MMNKLTLASSSPRRKDILTAFQIPFEIVLPDVEEKTLDKPIMTAEFNAKLKAENIHQKYPEKTVLASDTVVAVDHHILGKPLDEKDAYRILNLISGKKQLVISGYCIASPLHYYVGHDITEVYMKKMSEKEIWDYIKSGEPFGKAGAYAIQETGDQFVTKTVGSFHNVVGLPIEKILPILKELHLIP